jgi:hypothetical protein
MEFSSCFACHSDITLNDTQSKLLYFFTSLFKLMFICVEIMHRVGFIMGEKESGGKGGRMGRWWKLLLVQTWHK